MANGKQALSLPTEIFEVSITNSEILKLAYNAYLANGRTNLAKTLTRGKVRGGGKKPWRQKGTGRARIGSTRSPQWRKGGVVFGPLGNENYSLKMSTTVKRLAVKQALTLAAKDNEIIIVSDLTSNGKTKEVWKTLSELGVKEEDRVLLAVDHKTDDLMRSTKNLVNVKLTQAVYLNVFDIVNADKIVITKAGLVAIQEWLGGVGK